MTLTVTGPGALERLELSTAAGAPLADHHVSWTVQDPIAIALAAGFTPERHLRYLYEGQGPTVVPTLSNAIAGQWLPPLLERLGTRPSDALFGEFSMELFRELPPEGRVLVKGSIVEVGRLGDHAVLGIEVDAADESGPLVRAMTRLILPRRAGDAPDLKLETVHPRLPDRPADIVASERVAENAAAIHRLIFPLRPHHANGDAWHIDPDLAEQTTPGRPAVHGVTVVGIVLRTVLERAPRQQVAEYRVRFRRPTFPGDILTIRLWRASREWFAVAERDGSEILTGSIRLREEHV